ncbi:MULTISPECIES: hypothetical protein [Desulfovibrio]|uniref:Transmembrane protein n=1 Tax=Desulfovibrio desulfuricans TaxID=876 RepID=A0AA94L1B3_DESDE|nr:MULTISPECIES: hypothetical protein [Desulfovibrio]ATD81126.1 hypothetical protein CNY67_06830 [Desulfovibrio sp. G11]SFW23328.1 hypothetical protein SAMN02910291_00491 [Desulfovibrio desulfuricans]SPD36743.1 Hypothetical protein DSVG11_2709 [Desulfovibrio sp. G11]
MSGDQPFDYKKAWIDLHQENIMTMSKAAHSTRIAHFSAIIDYSKIAINGAFLLNGMAGIAIFSHLEKLGSTGIDSLMGCAWGAIFAVVCGGISYLAQRAYSSVFDKNVNKEIKFYFDSLQQVMRHDVAKEQRPTLDTAKLGNFLSVAACAFWCASVGCFLRAIYCSFPSL